MASSIGFGRGRDDDEALVSFPVGPLTLTFAVNVSTLIQLCRNVLAIAIPGDGPPQQH